MLVKELSAEMHKMPGWESIRTITIVEQMFTPRPLKRRVRKFRRWKA
jgi:hypothetical protein